MARMVWVCVAGCGGVGGWCECVLFVCGAEQREGGLGGWRILGYFCGEMPIFGI